MCSQPAPEGKEPRGRRWPGPLPGGAAWSWHSLYKAEQKGKKNLTTGPGEGQNRALTASNPTRHLGLQFPAPSTKRPFPSSRKNGSITWYSKRVTHHSCDPSHVKFGQRSPKTMALVCHRSPLTLAGAAITAFLPLFWPQDSGWRLC